MCRVETIVLAAVLLVECGALHMYPEIFDPAKFLQRPLPLREASADADGGAHFTDGFKDGEVGFVRSTSESGKGGYRHRENFHKKDGHKYGHEKQAGVGESKRSGEEAGEGKADHERLMVDTHVSRPEPTYEVIETQSDFENPDKHKKYGSSMKDKKKPTGKKPTGKKPTLGKQSSRRSPKAGTNQTKNHNGYESIVYHEHEQDSSEQGYGKRKADGKVPQAKKAAKQVAAHDEDAFDGEDHHEQESSERDYDHDYDGDSDGGDAGRESDFDDNYENVRFDADFEKSYGSGEQDGSDGDNGGKKGAGRSAGRQDQDYDYDEEVDRDEVDESASEDKYRGGEDSEEEDGDDRQYEYASEADGDAQDY